MAQRRPQLVQAVLRALAVLLALTTAPAVDASCAPPEPPRQALAQADAVFHGDVISTGRSTPLHQFFHWGYPVTFRVLESWKGLTTTRVTLVGHSDPGLAVPFARPTVPRLRLL